MKRVVVIAEAGVNHNGSMEMAREMIVQAKKAGVDIVKFQTFKSELAISKFAPKAAYQAETTGSTESQLEMVQRLELSYNDFKELYHFAIVHGITFLSTPFDLPSVDFLASLKMPCWKIPSGEITNLPYLRKIGQLQQKIFLSTGMSTLKEVGAALEVLEKEGTKRADITLLHCTTEYPAPLGEVNLRAMQTLQQAFPGIAGIGYSDHTKGIEVPIAAVAMGATVIEKHFTLDKGLEGPDHRASLEPDELAQMVRSIRKVEQALGSDKKMPTPSEIANRAVARKSLVARCPIRQGDVFSPENVTVKRPGTGLSPMLWDMVMGKRASRDFAADEALE